MLRGDGHDQTAPLGSAKTFLGIGPGWETAANTPFRLHKTWTHEGGISTPLIVQWPAGLPAHGELRNNPGHLIDLVPTILELAGGARPATIAGEPVPPLPGKSLVPVFAQDNSVARDYLWWFHDSSRAIRVGDWKLVTDHRSPWELYDLRTDRAESRNLAAANPGKVRELEQEWLKHEKEFHALAGQDLPPPAKAKKKPAPQSSE
ncbi:MAG: sulfatase-like hydrolase/transferase, partial [Verrucomicrobia bacterium]|nr:sulfatase-like hydrolase/transferase [Verrucomicrobiota bacterium]